MTKRIRLGAAALVVSALAGLTGCHGKPSAAPSATAGGLSEAQTVAILQEYTDCMHDHGVTGYQQPDLVDGTIQWNRSPAGADPDTLDAAVEACRSIVNKLPGSLTGRHQDPSAAELDKLRHFAECVRQHGFPDWPDPDSRGRFAIIGTPMEQALSKDNNLTDACRQYLDGMQLVTTTP